MVPKDGSAKDVKDRRKLLTLPPDAFACEMMLVETEVQQPVLLLIWVALYTALADDLPRYDRPTVILGKIYALRAVTTLGRYRGCLDRTLAGSSPARQRSQPQALEIGRLGTLPGQAASARVPTKGTHNLSTYVAQEEAIAVVYDVYCILQVLLLTLIWVAAYAAIAEAFLRRCVPIDIHYEFNLATEPNINPLNRFHDTLADNTPSYIVGGHSYLAPKDAKPGSPPGRWLKTRLIGETAADTTTLAFGDSDIYFVAFTNASNHWNRMPGYDTMFPMVGICPRVLVRARKNSCGRRV
ncbi:hypothetical protein ACP70R_025192 [Stipagrostis hirtigluma subsp. patula]